MRKKKKNLQPLLRFTFLVYLALMLWLLFGRSRGWVDGLSYGQMLQRNINLTPLLTIKNYLQVVLCRTNDSVYRHCLINLLGNVLLFIPAGWLLPGIWKRFRHFLTFTATCLAAIFLVELIQLLSLLGSFDIDDVILNMAGLWLGYAVYMLTHRKKRPYAKA